MIVLVIKRDPDRLLLLLLLLRLAGRRPLPLVPPPPPPLQRRRQSLAGDCYLPPGGCPYRLAAAANCDAGHPSRLAAVKR